MCDQTEVSYLDDDVVWVKIGPIWWPGVVKDLEKDDEGKEILASLKKKPIAAVKFFQEDNYEFVKNLDHIYHYSCRRKDEFIKKGLDKFRTGAPHMKKFPADVTTAESLTNGDVNIINDPKFYPEKKESYSEIFGSGKKKNKKDSELTPRPRGRPSAKITPYRPITHQRFINKVLHGESDHKVKTLIQCNSSPDDGASRNPYKCHICKFETSRVNVIVAHHRLSHSTKNSINWTGSDSRLVRRKPITKSRKIKSKKLFDTSKDYESDEEELGKKKSPKTKGLKEKVKKPEKSKGASPLSSPSKRKGHEDAADASDPKKPRFTDVLLADWDEDEEEDKKDKDVVSDASLDKSANDTDDKESKDENFNASVELCEKPDSPRNEKNQNEKMSCFDFDEEEEGFIGMSNANTYGRKIPRVIPVKDKSELGMDLEIEELFKKKSESELETSQEGTSKTEETEDNKNESELESGEGREKETNESPTVAKGPGKRRRSKASKEEETKANSEDSLALRRTRRPGSKKSYLNEVIEKVIDQDSLPESEKKESEKAETAVKVENKWTKEEGGSSSRRKQDFKHHTLDSDREEIVYSEMLSCEQKTKSEPEKKKSKTRDCRRGNSEELTAQIDSLLEETKFPTLPEISENSTDKSEEQKAANFSFDFLPGEQTGRRTVKSSKEVKSISRMFSDSLPTSESNSDLAGVPQGEVQAEEAKDPSEEKTVADVSQGKTVNLKFSPSNANTAQKRGSIVLSSVPAAEGAVAKVKVLPVMRQGNAGKDCLVLPAGKKLRAGEDTEQNSSEIDANRPKNIKAIKVKSDSLPPSLITAGKLKGQTIIHQKGGKYVIVTQSPPLGRQKATPGKVQSGSKVVILTNQLGEQKIITTSGLQQTKLKVDGQKIIATPDSVSDKDASTSATSGAVGQTQPVIKMVPDGKGGIMKQLTVSPKKVLLGGTKVLVSASGSTFSSGNSVQKITLSGAGGVARTGGGDYRLIENYKGSGKTVLIQGGSNAGSGVVLKSATGVPRQVTKVIQSPQAIPALNKKPKILMRASTSQGEYVVQPGESPTFVVKQKGTDGKFATQKIVRTEIMNQPKASGTGTKAFFISGQSSNKKGESYIITTNESVPGKVIRMRQKIKEVDVASPKTQKIIQKNPEMYAISQNSLLLPSETPTEAEAPQIVQIQEQNQQPVLQTQVIAMPGPVGADGNQTYVLVSVDENGVVQGMDNSVVAYDATARPDQIFVNPTSTSNVILINPPASEEATPVFSTSSQDILAEALANTNVLEGSINNEMDSVVPSILLPPSIPSSVVQETSITLQKPIMTPLEMPSSVAPDTSGLEPPPLPPTPTEEDVLMEDSEMSGGTIQEQQQKEVEANSSDPVHTYLQTGSFDSGKPTEFQTEEQKMFEGEGRGEGNKKVTEYYQSEELNDNTTAQTEQQELPNEEYVTENSQEQSANTFQSLPVLNDEPDTSDDVQGTESIGEQQFDAEKARSESEQFSQLLRDQEPPSSTNNEMMTESNQESKFEGSKYENYNQTYDQENGEKEPKGKESEDRISEELSEGQKEKELIGNREIQSLPAITDENNVNSYDIDPMYSDVMSQKRFQEETEVSSTTDEFSNKEVTN